MSFDSLRKLFKEIGRFRASRAWRRGRVRLGYAFGDGTDALARRLAADWRGGYVPFGDSGDWIYIPAQLDAQGRRLLIQGGRPEPVASLLCRAGDIAIDLGGNLGEWMLPLARATGSQGRVYVFEPVAVLADALSRTAHLNGLTGTEVIAAAAAESSGEADFAVTMAPGGDGALSHLLSGSGEAAAGKTRVRTVALDDFVATRGLKRLDLLKIDVEGAERRILEGARRTLSTLKPRLVFETGHEAPADRAAISDILTGAGYELAGVVLDGVIVDTSWEEFRDPNGPFSGGVTRNLLALPKP